MGFSAQVKGESVATWLRHKVREVTQSIARESVADLQEVDEEDNWAACMVVNLLQGFFSPVSSCSS